MCLPKQEYGTCETCEAWSGNYYCGYSKQECRRHPPSIKVEPFDPDNPVFTYPVTDRYQGCHDFIGD
jgi:hypothetical protein